MSKPWRGISCASFSARRRSDVVSGIASLAGQALLAGQCAGAAACDRTGFHPGRRRPILPEHLGLPGAEAPAAAVPPVTLREPDLICGGAQRQPPCRSGRQMLPSAQFAPVPQSPQPQPGFVARCGFVLREKRPEPDHWQFARVAGGPGTGAAGSPQRGRHSAGGGERYGQGIAGPAHS